MLDADADAFRLPLMSFSLMARHIAAHYFRYAMP